MKKIFTMGGKFDARNYTVKDIIDQKGEKKLCQLLVSNVEEAAAAQDAGIDMAITGVSGPYPKIRDAMPDTFLTVALSASLCPTIEEAVKQSYKIMSVGADAIMCSSWNKDYIQELSKFGFPVMGHAGLVPRHSTWTGGLKAVGKTLAQAQNIYNDIKSLENAGAFAVEIEVIPEKLLAEISKRTKLVTISLGSGKAGDVHFLFSEDILGENKNMLPRHAKSYRKFYQLKEKMQQERVSAYKEFKNDVTSGKFPSEQYIVKMNDEIINQFIDNIDNK
tara:strand:- start:5726 stop:6556 length:831 start_codon:yes stop_codon:yes gene_type:complete